MPLVRHNRCTLLPALPAGLGDHERRCTSCSCRRRAAEGKHARHPRFVCVGVATISRRRQHRDTLPPQHHLPRQLTPVLLAYGVSVERENQLPSLRDKQLIARIKRLHRGGMHVRQIATKVTAEGHRSRSGAPMSKSTVARLLRG